MEYLVHVLGARHALCVANFPASFEIGIVLRRTKHPPEASTDTSFELPPGQHAHLNRGRRGLQNDDEADRVRSALFSDFIELIQAVQALSLPTMPSVRGTCSSGRLDFARAFDYFGRPLAQRLDFWSRSSRARRRPLACCITWPDGS
jgi:hypothetical protein